ncbi:MAG TPA: hypothetical protein VL991_08330 [Terracidiphilus sp.]|jgi:predicted permease|nr:hypothetical protein [Terracidiphilus sp.]
MHLAAALLAQAQPDPVMIRHIAMAMIAILPVIMLLAIAIFMVPCWFILKKAGFSPWLSMLCIFPTLGTLIVLYIVAFADWKTRPAAQAVYPPMAPTA